MDRLILMLSAFVVEANVSVKLIPGVRVKLLATIETTFDSRNHSIIYCFNAKHSLILDGVAPGGRASSDQVFVFVTSFFRIFTSTVCILH
jgi:hypothetical protein